MSLPTPNLSQRIDEIINFDKWIFFVLLTGLFLIIRYLTDELILQAIPGYRILEEKGTFAYFHLFNAIHYFWTPFSLLWKFTLTAFIIWVGAFMAGYKLPYKDLWQFTMIAEIIFVFPELIRLLRFLFLDHPENFQAVKNFHPLSLFTLVGAEQAGSRFYYPLRALNLFELAYWFVLATGVYTIGRRDFVTSLKIVLGSYSLCFLLWLGFYVLVYKT